jgi:ABC-2 type transport system permease protein
VTNERALTRWDAFKALCLARFREFYRETEVVFWSFVFPIALAFILGIAFRNRPPEPLPVAVVEGPRAQALLESLAKDPLLTPMLVSDAEAARALRRGRVPVAVVARDGGVEFRFDPSRPDSVVARARVDNALQRGAGRSDPVRAADVAVSEPGARYIDFLIPGLVGLNLMGGGMWGVGFSLVDMRIKKLLKRMLATPLRRSDFMASIMFMRFVFMFVEVGFVLAFGRILFGVPIRGWLPSVLLVGALGSFCFSSLGLLVASRAQRIEGVMGLMNVVMLPMWACSGVFFSWERFPAVVHPLIRALPLTALNDALRAVILEGASLASQAGPLAVLALWGALGFALGLKLFRWT